MYKPDLGLKLFQDGIRDDKLIHFPNFRLFNITIVSPGQYTTMVNMPYENDIYALSLDFNYQQLIQILEHTNLIYKNAIIRDISHAPNKTRTIELATEIEFNMVAQLGQLQKNQKESYIPLLLKNIEGINSLEMVIGEIQRKTTVSIGFIITGLSEGDSSTLNRLSFSICGDLSMLKIYEIESFVLKEEIAKLSQLQLDMIKNAIESSKTVEVDELDIFNYLYKKIDIYEKLPFTKDDFFNLLNRQCWLETLIETCQQEYEELSNQLLSQVQLYTPSMLYVPDFALNAEDSKFYFIFGKDINELAIDEYENYLLCKLTLLIQREEIDDAFIDCIELSNEDGRFIQNNPKIYQQLPPFYFAKQIMQSRPFKIMLQELSQQKIKFSSLDDEELEKRFLEEDKFLFDLVESAMQTSIYDTIFFKKNSE